MFDKTTIIAFAVVVAIVAAVVGVLHHVHPTTVMDATVSCEQINFDTTGNDVAAKPASLLDASLWVDKVTLVEWEFLTFRTTGVPLPTQLSGLGDVRQITAKPNSPNARIELRSNPDAFALRDVFGDGACRASWGVHDLDYHIALTPSTRTSEVVVTLSTGDDLQMTLVDCTIMDGDDRPVFRTTPGRAQELSLPVSFATREVIIVATSGRIELVAQLQADAPETSVVLMKDIRVSNVDYVSPEFSADGSKQPRNTLKSGFVRWPQQQPGNAFQLSAADVVVVEPSGGRLRELRADRTDNVSASIIYRASSFRVGTPGSSRELVPSLLDRALGNRILLLVYSASVVMFGFVTRHVLKKSGGR